MSNTREVIKHANGVYKHKAKHIKTTTVWKTVQDKLDEFETTDLPKKADKILIPVEDNILVQDINWNLKDSWVKDSDLVQKTELDLLLDTKVDKVVWKELSTNDFTDILKTLLETKKVKDVTTDPVNDLLVVTYTDDTVSNLNINDIVTDIYVSWATLDWTTNILTLTASDWWADVTVNLSDFVNSSELVTTLNDYYIKSVADTTFEPKNTNIQTHISDVTTNPHNVTKTQVWLSNVDNTTDLLKPISTSTQSSLDTKVDKSLLYIWNSWEQLGSPDDMVVNSIMYQDSTEDTWVHQDGAIYWQFYSSGYGHQIFGDYRSGNLAVRGKDNGTWTPWLKVSTSNDILVLQHKYITKSSQTDYNAVSGYIPNFTVSITPKNTTNMVKISVLLNNITIDVGNNGDTWFELHRNGSSICTFGYPLGWRSAGNDKWDRLVTFFDSDVGADSEYSVYYHSNDSQHIQVNRGGRWMSSIVLEEYKV